MTDAIRVRHLWHRYGTFDAIRDVSFSVRHGEVFGFIGPNGAGKTTTIRILATLVEPAIGRVEVDGYDVAVDPDKVRRIIGYMPDHAGVYEHLSVREYLEFFADAHQLPGKGYEVVDAVMELTDLVRLRDKLVVTMSKGMKQRLQLARVLLHDPQILILDEPASDLDPRARIEIRDLLGELRNMGKTIFIASHILTELSDICTSVAILERGQLVAVGPIRDIAQQVEALRGKSVRSASSGTAASALPAVPSPAAVTRSLKLRVLGPPETAISTLKTIAGVISVNPASTGHLIVRYEGDEPQVAEIVRLLVLANIGVLGVEPERNELERLFLEVTRGELQ